MMGAFRSLGRDDKIEGGAELITIFYETNGNIR
jgi:hypothetical protein